MPLESRVGAVSTGSHLPAAGRLVRGSALRTVQQFALAGVSFAMMPFIVHTLGDRHYGIWALVGTFIGFTNFLDFGLSSAVTRFLAAGLGSGDEEQCNRFFNTALALYIVIGALVLTGGCAAAGVVYLWPGLKEAALLAKVILICSMSVTLSFPLRVFVGTLNAHLRFDRTASLDLATLLLRTTLAILVLEAGYGVVGLALVTFLSALPSFTLSVYFCHKDLPFLRLHHSYRLRAAAKELFSYSSFSFVIQIADLMRLQTASLVVATFLGLAAVTHFRVATVMTTYFLDLMTALFGVLMSVFSQQAGAKDHDGIRKTFFFANKVAIAVSSFIAFGLIAWGKPFITRWMGPRYVDAYGCLMLLALAYVFALWQNPSISLLYGLAKHRWLAGFGIIEGAINVLMALWLVPQYGILGAALAILAGTGTIKLLVQPVYVCHIAGVPLWEYLRREGAAIATVAAALVTPALVTGAIAGPDYKRLVLTGLVSLACYAPPVWFLLFTSGERQALVSSVWRGRDAAAEAAS
jgi:O-antigen/teichoic acid export membrane protein